MLLMADPSGENVKGLSAHPRNLAMLKLLIQSRHLLRDLTLIMLLTRSMHLLRTTSTIKAYRMALVVIMDKMCRTDNMGTIDKMCIMDKLETINKTYRTDKICRTDKTCRTDKMCMMSKKETINKMEMMSKMETMNKMEMMDTISTMDKMDTHHWCPITLTKTLYGIITGPDTPVRSRTMARCTIRGVLHTMK